MDTLGTLRRAMADHSAYLDHAATTALRPEARAAMLPFLGGRLGNPSGSHAAARAARAAVEEARETVAAAVGADPSGVVFTGSGTEADNLAVLGIGGPVVVSAIEHEAVLAPARTVGARLAPVDATGVVDLEALADLLDGDVRLVSVMAANNEVGTIQPLADVARLVRRRSPGALLHTDAVQGFPWLDLSGQALRSLLLSLSAHKLGGPQGVGALVVPEAARGRLAPQLLGGGQEAGRRSGTHNVAGIVGMAAAVAATVRDREATVARVSRLRDRLADGLAAAVPGLRETVPRHLRVAGNCHVLVPGVESEELLFLLDEAGVCASAGSACASGALEPSHVLAAMGVPESEARGALRLSLGWSTTDADVDAALAAVPAAVSRLRGERGAGETAAGGAGAPALRRRPGLGAPAGK
jgi:cysteine desulfurase